ncbi:MAG: menaquinone-dependent protoporphyrinogen IX dehydrogenase [Desulfobacteraceae bacterium]|nr:menaquinone-dependent protoporphyrinogen IX dehydrogenase [Desulfobacteraceae bacterium]
MANILFIYATTDGQTKKISLRLQKVIEQQGHKVTLCSITECSGLDLQSFDKIVIGASIRYGRHSPLVTDFINRNKKLLDSKSNAFFSVNVVARKPEKSRPEANPYLQKFLRRISWNPKELAVFAGKIDYPSYRFIDWLMIRLIIHRDPRFSRDKPPYKSTLWLTFKRPLSDWQDAPAFFFELGADSWRYGMGFYSASKETMDRLRQLIERKPVEFEQMIAFLADQDRFIVEGEQYKRLINPAVSEHLRPWHQRKSVYLACNRLSDRQLFDKELLRELITGFMYIGPYSGEGPTIESLHAFIRNNGHERCGKHHEIYLSDPRRTAPEKLKSIIRQPMQ